MVRDLHTRGLAPRWSKKIDELVRHVAQRCRPGLQSELGHWLESSSRFRDFVSANQDKVRKKLTSSDDEDSRLDVRSELLVAYLLLADRRFELSFEAYGARRLGPDLTALFRTNQRFNIEVTRLRYGSGEPAAPRRQSLLASSHSLPRRPPADVADDLTTAVNDTATAMARIANVIAGKLRQLPGDVPNMLAITARGLALGEDPLGSAVRKLKTHCDQKDDAFFARRGFKDARGFYGHYLHLSGIVLLDEANGASGAIVSSNREARHPVPKEAFNALTRCLSSAGGTAE